jgi:hypothetical protein
MPVSLSGSLLITGSLTASGTLTAQTLVVQTVTSSIVYSSGSNIFGNSLTDIQKMTGSLRVTGSLSLNNIAIPTSASLASTYLPLAGGTLTGALSGTSATFRVNADRNLAIKYDTNVTLSSQGDSGGPESLRIFADTFRIFTATTAVGLTERFTISNAGKVLIGKDSSTGGVLQVSNGTNMFNVDYDADGPYITAVNNANTVYKRLTIDASEILFDISAAEKMRITSGGNVGIGGTPENKFNVFAGTGATFRATANGTNVLNIGNYSSASGFRELQIAASDLSFSTGTAGAGSTTQRMRITSAGAINIVDSYFLADSANGYRFNNQADTFNNVIMYDNGNVSIRGALSKGSGSFRIKHPLASKKNTHQLVHSFIEGPRADLIYRGKIRLNAGKATINIDEASTMTEGTFKALCREVQCFTTNETGWDNVRGKVTGNILTIESQNTESTDEISWMVVGERQDEHMMDTDWTDSNGKVIVEPLIPGENN